MAHIRRKNTCLKIGLTGGIGAGKTVISDRLRSLGASIIDTDRISHAITGPHGSAIPTIKKTFGTPFIRADGSLNRKAMRDRIFSNSTEKAKLESIMHPLIHSLIASNATKVTGSYVVFVIPLLVEKYEMWCKKLHRILVVDCDEDEQILRVVGRSRLSIQDIRKIMENQSNRVQRLSIADDVINNQNKTLLKLFDEVDELHHHYLDVASKLQSKIV